MARGRGDDESQSLFLFVVFILFFCISWCCCCWNVIRCRMARQQRRLTILAHQEAELIIQLQRARAAAEVDAPEDKELRCKVLNQIFPEQQAGFKNLAYDAETNRYEHTNEKAADSCCSICLEDFEDDGVVVSKCLHAYHRDCIMSWSEIKNECPKCRQPMWDQSVYDALAKAIQEKDDHSSSSSRSEEADDEETITQQTDEGSQEDNEPTTTSTTNGDSELPSNNV